MKHDQLRAVVHNVAHSLVAWRWMLDEIDIFSEASPSGGRLTIDLLAGRIVEGRKSRSLDRRVVEARTMLAKLCDDAGIGAGHLTVARVDLQQGIVSITIRDTRGKTSTVDYDSHGARVRILDAGGRIRVRPAYRRPLD